MLMKTAISLRITSNSQTLIEGMGDAKIDVIKNHFEGI